MTDTIHTNVKAVWDIKTADTCRLPELIPNICERCRDYRYCHRQLGLFEKREINDDHHQRPTHSTLLR